MIIFIQSFIILKASFIFNGDIICIFSLVCLNTPPYSPHSINLIAQSPINTKSLSDSNLEIAGCVKSQTLKVLPGLQTSPATARLRDTSIPRSTDLWSSSVALPGVYPDGTHRLLQVLIRWRNWTMRVCWRCWSEPGCIDSPSAPLPGIRRGRGGRRGTVPLVLAQFFQYGDQ